MVVGVHVWTHMVVGVHVWTHMVVGYIYGHTYGTGDTCMDPHTW